MATDYDTFMNQEQRKPGTRRLLLLPPLLLVVSAAALLLTAPFSWGAAAVIEAPDWTPPALGIIVGLGALWVGVYAFRSTLSNTHIDFEVSPLQIAFGVFMFISGAALLLSLSLRLADEDTYRVVLDDNGQLEVHATGYFAGSILFGLFQIGWVWAGAYLYSNAVTNQAPNRISARRPGEVDGIGELLKERE